VVTTQSKAEPVKDNLTKVNFDKVAYVGDGGDLTATSAAAGAHTLIIATGGTVTGPQFLQGGQTFQGGASTINVQGQRSGDGRAVHGAGRAADVLQRSRRQHDHGAWQQRAHRRRRPGGRRPVRVPFGECRHYRRL
jgi:hypothetical protein